ncbi:BQ5605_C017g08452 [Microbotryum silenes-dioicae]|uniref:BQ5605_C017g08452 protein n=1 Tax=Microbotryum silenes-dioicae TaxID=796604 RepID=A0A2X0NYB5_9BASI|nr:BQ5605_C017g08452 [Microbotryum silenes-dioicae]
MAVCAHCKARHWECERSKSTGHYSTCCSQGKVQLPPLSGPIPSIDSCLKGRIPRPTFAKTWLICPAEAADTQLGPDGADSRIQRSTLTKLNSTLRTGNRFLAETDAPTTFLRRAPKWRCLSAIPTPTREIVDVKTLFSRCTVIDVPMVGPSTKSLARSIRLRCLSVTHYSSPQRKIAPTSTFLFARSTKLGHFLPKDRDEEEGDAGNGDGERQVKGSRWRVSRSPFFVHYLPNATSTSQSRIAPNVPSWKPTNLRLTTTQGIDGLTPNQMTFDDLGARRCDGVRCQPWKASAAHHDDVRLRLTGNQGCTGADKACNCPNLIARVFEAKSGNTRHAGCFGDEYKMNGFCFFAVFRILMETARDSYRKFSHRLNAVPVPMQCFLNGCGVRAGRRIHAKSTIYHHRKEDELHFNSLTKRGLDVSDVLLQAIACASTSNLDPHHDDGLGHNMLPQDPSQLNYSDLAPDFDGQGPAFDPEFGGGGDSPFGQGALPPDDNHKSESDEETVEGNADHNKSEGNVEGSGDDEDDRCTSWNWLETGLAEYVRDEIGGDDDDPLANVQAERVLGNEEIDINVTGPDVLQVLDPIETPCHPAADAPRGPPPRSTQLSDLNPEQMLSLRYYMSQKCSQVESDDDHDSVQ